MGHLKKEICAAFCSDIRVSEFDGGYAIGTPYYSKFGDRIGIYALEKESNIFRLVDNALTISFLEAEGATLDSQTRRKALDDLLKECDAEYDDETGELFVDGVKREVLPQTILTFAAVLLRINDLTWMSQEKARSTFRDDVRARLRKAFEGTASIREDEPVSDALKDILPDMVIAVENRDPVAIFIATDDLKVTQAMLLRLIADYESRTSVLVVAILQRDGLISRGVRQQADNRLDAIPRFEGEPDVAIQRVWKQVTGRPMVIH